MKIEIIAPGSDVTIGKDVRALVLQVAIKRGSRVEYEVAWWDGRRRVTDWLLDTEVSADPSAVNHHTVGFVR